MNNNDYPYFVKKESDFFSQSHVFTTGSYMSDNDVELIYKKYPNGCAEHPSEYTIFYKDKTIIQWMYLLNKNDFSKINNKIISIEKDNQGYLWDFMDLIDYDYCVIFDKDFNITVCKNKIRPNKHTKVKILKSMPTLVKDVLNNIQPFILSMIEIGKECEQIIKTYHN